MIFTYTKPPAKVASRTTVAGTQEVKTATTVARHNAMSRVVSMIGVTISSSTLTHVAHNFGSGDSVLGPSHRVHRLP